MAPPRPLRVLMVEDYPDVATSTAEILRLSGHDVRLAVDGPTALKAAQADEPDVVLLDLGLPKMDGYEVARRLTASCGHKPYLIAVSGHGRAEDRRRSAEAGIDLHLLKPADPAWLLRVLEERHQMVTG
jgi:CheY-like chemotaxis protein